MRDELFDLSEQVVVITGGLGQLGRAWTRALLAANARVAIFELDPPALIDDDPLAPALAAGRLQLLAADVTRRASLEAALQQLAGGWGVPHGLINAAALDSPPDAPAAENGPFESYPEDSWDRVLEVNLKGVFLSCQVIGGAMAVAGRGSVINISSIYGAVSPDQRIYEHRRQAGETFFKPVAYSASKSGLANLTRYLATYWAGQGVRVNTLTLAGVFNHQPAEFLEEYCRRVPLGRMAEPDEYDGAIAFLLSPASRYMTGSNLVVDGGWTAW